MNDCTKIRYASPAVAKWAARQIAANYRKRGIRRVPRGIHPCAECHAWHVTSHRTNAKFRVLGA
jgi:hypothetical protein